MEVALLQQRRRMVNIHEDARRKRHVQHAEDEWQPCVKENSKNRNTSTISRLGILLEGLRLKAKPH